MSYLPEKKRNLTEKQQAFLNNLVETGGDFKKSAELAGYSGNHYQILKSLNIIPVEWIDEVISHALIKEPIPVLKNSSTNKNKSQKGKQSKTENNQAH